MRCRPSTHPKKVSALFREALCVKFERGFVLVINVEATLHSPRKIPFISIVSHMDRVGSDMIGKVVANISDDTIVRWGGDLLRSISH